jgi:hypothetical protein
LRKLKKLKLRRHGLYWVGFDSWAGVDYGPYKTPQEAYRAVRDGKVVTPFWCRRLIRK